MSLNDSDKFLVERNGQAHYVQSSNMSNLADDDLLLVERSGTAYKINGADIKETLDPTQPPVLNSIVLTEDDSSGPRFTGQNFTTTVSVADPGNPVAPFGIKGIIEANAIDKLVTSNITAVDNSTNINIWRPTFTGRTRTSDVSKCCRLMYRPSSGLYVMGTNYEVFTSTDLLTWTMAYEPGRGIKSMAYDESIDQFAIAGDKFIAYSNDGINWTKVLENGGNSWSQWQDTEWFDCAYVNDMWVFWTGQVGLNSNSNKSLLTIKDFTSTTSGDWKYYIFSVSGMDINRNRTACAGNGSFLAVKQQGLKNSNNWLGTPIGLVTQEPEVEEYNSQRGLQYNPVGGRINDDAGIVNAGSNVEWINGGIAFGGGLFSNVYDRTVWYSKDGINWGQTYYEVQFSPDNQKGTYFYTACMGYGGGKHVRLSSQQEDFFISYDGITWSQVANGLITRPGENWEFSEKNGDVLFAEGRYLVCAYGRDSNTESSSLLTLMESTTLGAAEICVTVTDDTLLNVLTPGDKVTTSDQIANGVVVHVDEANKKIYLRDVDGTIQPINNNKLIGPSKPFATAAITSRTQLSSKWSKFEVNGSQWQYGKCGAQGHTTELSMNVNNSSTVNYGYRTKDNPQWTKGIKNSSTGSSLITFWDDHYWVWGTGTSLNEGKLFKFAESEITNLQFDSAHTVGNFQARTIFSAEWDGATGVVQVAQRWNGSQDEYTVYYSTNNGVSWSEVNFPNRQFARAVAYGNGVWVVVGQGRNWYTSDLAANDWTQGITKSHTDVIFDGTQFIAVYDDKLRRSVDGVEWEEYYPKNFDGNVLSNKTQFKYLRYYKGIYMLVGNGAVQSSNYQGSLYISFDSENWMSVSPNKQESSSSEPNSFFATTLGAMGITINYTDGTTYLYSTRPGTYGLDSCEITFADSTNLDKFRQGDRISVVGKEHYGHVLEKDGNTITIVYCTFEGNKFVDPGDVLVSAPNENAVELTKYLLLTESLIGYDISDDDPGYRAFTGTTPKIQMAEVFLNGEAPDAVLLDGSAIKTTVKVDNLIGISVKDSNVVTPTGTTRGIGGFDINDPAEASAFADLQTSLNEYGTEKIQLRTNAAQTLRAANYTEDQITAAGLQDA